MHLLRICGLFVVFWNNFLPMCAQYIGSNCIVTGQVGSLWQEGARGRIRVELNDLGALPRVFAGHAG